MLPALSEYDYKSNVDDSVSDVDNSVPTSYQYPRKQLPSPGDSPEKSIPATIRQPWESIVTVHEGTFERMISKGRKRSTFDDGIDLDNIIHISDDENEKCLSKDTRAIFSYKTRAQLHGFQRSELCYDQKYHPMDKYTQPKRAAKLKSKYGECSPIPDDERDASHFEDSNDVLGSIKEECSTRTKRMKSSSLAPLQGTMQSSRQVNMGVLCDSKVHPQDVQVEEIGLKLQELRSDGADTGEENKHEMDKEQSKEHEHGINVMDGTIPNKGDSSIAHSLSSSIEPLPLSTIGQRRSLVDNTQRKDSTMQPLELYKGLSPLCRGSLDTGQPFSIFTEDLQTQLNAETSAGPQIFFDDDDKENNDPNLDTQSAPAFRENTDDDSEEDIPPNSDFLTNVYDQPHGN